MTLRALAYLLALAGLWGNVTAAARPLPPLPGQVFLAKTTTCEAALRPGADTAAIFAVAVRRGQVRGESWRRALRAYSACWPLRAATRWIADLSPDGHRPKLWGTGTSRGMSWTRKGRPSFLALYRQAGEVIRGDVVAPCAPDYFGDRHGDLLTARRHGWIRVDCGDTANLYWCVPGVRHCPRRRPKKREQRPPGLEVASR